MTHKKQFLVDWRAERALVTFAQVINSGEGAVRESRSKSEVSIILLQQSIYTLAGGERATPPARTKRA